MDLLLLICEHALPVPGINPTTSRYTSPLAPMHFQLVCKRFRSTALLVPYLWACVDDRMSVDRMRMQMSRCANYVGDVGFQISYRRTPASGPCKCAQWRLIASNKSRWTSAYVRLNVVYLPSATTPYARHDCLQTLHGLHLPRLASLYADFDGSSDAPIRESIGWTMPCLENFTCTSDVALLLPRASPLKTLTFSPPELSSSTRASLRYPLLLCFLRTPTASNLTHITLDFSKRLGFGHALHVPWMSKFEDVVVLEGVRNMSLDISCIFDEEGTGVNWDPVFAVLSYLYLHSLENVRVRCSTKLALMSVEADVRVWGWLKAVRDNAAGSLQRVEVVVLLRDEDGETKNDVYEDVMFRLQEVFTEGERGKTVEFSVEIEVFSTING